MIVPTFVRDIKEKYANGDIVVVSPDVGGVVRARALASKLEAPLAIVDKRRPHPGASQVMNIIGDIDKKDCILVDDIVDSAGTLCNAAEALCKFGAKSVTAYATHGVLSGSAMEKVRGSSLAELVVTDSIYDQAKIASCEKMRVISIAPLLGEAIRGITMEQSMPDVIDNLKGF
jgi:ribose-phosphate pyrophosphokinase